MPWTRILVPVDLDDLHRFVLPYAARLARLFTCPVTVLHVLEGEHAVKYGASGEAAALRAKARAAAEDHVRAVSREEVLAGLTVTTEVHEGPRPGEALLTLARPDDVLCLPARTHGAWRRLLFGSVTEELLHATRTPILLVRVPEDGIPATDVRLERVLVPTDLSGLAETAVETARELAARTGGKILLVHVCEEQPPAGFQLAGIRSLLELKPELRRELEARLNERARNLLTGAPHEVHLLCGAPAATIAAFTRDHGVDLVVMASRGHDTLGDHFFGSTTDRVVRSVSVPVVVLPAAL